MHLFLCYFEPQPPAPGVHRACLPQGLSPTGPMSALVTWHLLACFSSLLVVLLSPGPSQSTCWDILPERPHCLEGWICRCPGNKVTGVCWTQAGKPAQPASGHWLKFLVDSEEGELFLGELLTAKADRIFINGKCSKP